MDFTAATTVLLTDKALFFSIAVSVFFVVFLTAMMIFFVIRYSRKRHPVASAAKGNIWLEVTWTVVPTLLALVMFYQGFVSYRIARTPPAGSMEITVIARMWEWMFQYPDKRQSPILYLPVGRPINLLLQSKDVIHGFFVPAFRLKQDVVPGRTNHVSSTPLETGTYDIFCTQYCGKGHATMHTTVVTLRPADFYAWYRAIPPQKPVKMSEVMAGSPEQIAHGKDVYLTQCVNCHGTDGRGEGLPNARNFTSLSGWKNGPKITQMFRTVANGLGEQMPSFSNLPVEDRFAAIHFVRTLTTGQPPDTREEIEQLDKDFDLSKGRAAPPEIPVEEAMRKLAAESTATLHAAVAATTGTIPVAVLTEAQLKAARAKNAQGAGLYARDCASCHGERGEGKSRIATIGEIQAAALSSRPLSVRRADWQTGGVERFRERIREVSVATGGLKPTFGTLSQQNWDALYAFVLALSEGTAGAASDGSATEAERQ